MLTERQSALDRLRDLFTQCLQGNGRMTLISGGLASGKTELLHAFTDNARKSGALVLSATGERNESSLQFGAIWQLFHSSPLSQEITETVAPLISVENSTAEPSETRAEDTDRRSRAHTSHVVCEALLKLSLDRPLVISVDDVQFIDDASFRILLSLRRRIRSARILIALTERTRPYPSPPLFYSEVTRQPHSWISLNTFPVAGIIEELSQHMSTAEAAELAPAMYRLSGGNPLLVRALVEDQALGCADTPEQGTHRPVSGVTYRQAVLDCLYRWDPILFEIAYGLAMLGEYGAPELVTRLLGRTGDSVRQGFAVLTEAGLLVEDRFRHPEIATTILNSTSPGDTARLHAWAAELLYEHGAEAVQVARYLVASDAAPNSWALRVLRQAAAQAMADDDVDLAVQSLELAMRACEDDQERLAIQSTLVEVAWRVNPSGVARHVVPLNAAMHSGALTHRDAVPVIRHLLWQGDFAAANKPFEVVTGSEDSADARPIAELELSYAWIRGKPHCLSGRTCTLDDGAQTSSLSDNPWIRAARVLHSLWNQRSGDKPVSSDEIVRSAEHILQGRLSDMMPEAAAIALLGLDYAGSPKRALFWCETLLAEATPKGATTWRAVLGSVRADLALRRGDLAGAAAHAREVLDLLHTQSWGVLFGFPLSTLILAHTAMGKLEAASELLDRVVPDAMFDTIFGARYLHARGHYQLAVGHPFAALHEFERCGTLMQDRGIDTAALVAWRTDLAQAHLSLGQQSNARALAREQLERSGSAPVVQARGTALRVLAASSRLQERVPMLRESVELLERCGDRLELARALAELSQAYRKLGELGQGRLTARRADQEAKACNAAPLPASSPDRSTRPKQVSFEQRPLDGAGSDTTLSDAEHKVAALAAAGHTNRDIGRQLYITVSTVEQHLTRIYRKLNVNRRTDLPPHLSHPSHHLSPVGGDTVRMGHGGP